MSKYKCNMCGEIHDTSEGFMTVKGYESGDTDKMVCSEKCAKDLTTLYIRCHLKRIDQLYDQMFMNTY